MIDIHKRLSETTRRHKEELESEYKKYGKDVIITISITYLLFISGCLSKFNKIDRFSENVSPDKISNKSDLPPIITTTTTLQIFGFLTTTTIKVLEPICKTKQIEIIYVNQTLNISDLQEKEFMNMKPDTCATIGCNQGFFMCKDKSLNILKLSTPKYSEIPAHSMTEVNDFAYIIISNDGYTDYVEFNKSFWYEVPNQTQIKIRRYINKTDMSYRIYEQNGTNKTIYF